MTNILETVKHQQRTTHEIVQALEDIKGGFLEGEGDDSRDAIDLDYAIDQYVDGNYDEALDILNRILPTQPYQCDTMLRVTLAALIEKEYPEFKDNLELVNNLVSTVRANLNLEQSKLGEMVKDTL